MTETNLRLALDITRSAVTEAGNELKQYYGNVEALTKGDGTSIGGVVTELDRKTEQFLAAELGKFSTAVGFRANNIGASTYDYKNHDFLITNARIHDELTNGPGAIFPIK